MRPHQLRSTVALLLAVGAPALTLPAWATGATKKAPSAATAPASAASSTTNSGVTSTTSIIDPRAAGGSTNQGSVRGAGAVVINPGGPRIPGDQPTTAKTQTQTQTQTSTGPKKAAPTK